MPYIKQERRTSETLDAPQNSGELNWAITMLIKNYFDRSAQNYQAINDIIGAVEGAKVEFQRRVVNNYEDKKIEANGDCY